MNKKLQVVVVLLLSAFCPVGQAQATEPTEGIKGQLESEFRAVTGLGFTAFDCTYPNGWPGSREILCDATDDEGDQFYYRLMFPEGENAPRSTMKQPVSQLNPAGLASLSGPSDAFLAAFARSDWNAAFDALSPELQEKLDRDGLRNILEPLKARLGEVTGEPQAAFYASPGEGLHQLDYTFSPVKGPAVARFRFTTDAEGSPRILAFLLTAEPGSPLQALLLEETGKATLARFFDQPIASIQGPLASLEYIGDVEEVTLQLADGSQLMARVEQHGSTYDLDSNDYRFQLLDLETIIALHYSSTAQAVETIDCPVDVAPDGGSIDCDVTDASGASRKVQIMRRGGQHRLLEPD